MPAFSEFKKTQRVKLLIAADSGSGKTGCLASLANAGYRLRIIDLEDNLNVLNSYLTEEGIKNVHWITIDPEDPKAAQGIQALTRHWKIGAEDLGKTSSWTNKDVLVIDSATRLGDACLAATKPANSDGRTHYISAGQEFDEIMDYILGPALNCNIVVTAHLRYKEVVQNPGPGQDPAKMPKLFRIYPTCLGDTMTTRFSRGFTDVFGIEVSSMGNKVTRHFRTDADSMMGMKSSAPSVLKLKEDFDLGAIFNKLLA